MNAFELKSPAAIIEQYTTEETEVKQKLAVILKTVVKSDFDVAELLYLIKKKGYYAPYNSFPDWVASEVSIRAQKARYLCKIAETCEKLNIPRSQYEPVGKSKLRVICSLDISKQWTNPLTGENTPISEFVKGFIEKGQELSLEEVTKHVKTLKGLVGPDELVFFRTSVKKAAMEETIRPALELAKNQLGTSNLDEDGMAIEPSDGKALEVIAVSFLNDPANVFLGEQ